MWRRKPAAPAPLPVLDLSGPRLAEVFEHLVAAAEPTGGVERYVGALWLKHSLFAERLGDGRAATLDEAAFCDLCAFIMPARRRVGRWLLRGGFAEMRLRLERLFAGADDTATADSRLAAFLAGFPADREHRWARDLAAEALHFAMPDAYPLMTRWMWDAGSNTGVLREIWYAEDVDTLTIPAPDLFATFAALRSELDGFLSKNGVFRDLPFYADLLCAHVYAFYITGRGGQYLRSDFAASEDPMAHTRRLLGLDAVTSERGRARLKIFDGSALRARDPAQLAASGVR